MTTVITALFKHNEEEIELDNLSCECEQDIQNNNLSIGTEIYIAVKSAKGEKKYQSIIPANTTIGGHLKFTQSPIPNTNALIDEIDSGADSKVKNQVKMRR